MSKDKKIMPIPIPDLIERYNNLKGDKTVTIFLTEKEYDFEPTLTLSIKDCFDGEEGFIDMFKLAALKDTLEENSDADTIIVSCDAGISRSPATASAIALLYGDVSLSENIRYYYKFYNEDLFDFIIKYWKMV
jgi:predicted protein tyrosine phosphatase